MSAKTDESVASYRAVVVGSGQGGTPLAKALANAGWRVALVERSYVGGSCLNYGCTPTKTMVASARIAYQAGRAGEFGVHAAVSGVDMTVVRARKREMVESSRAGLEISLLETTNLDLIYGEARFTALKTLTIRLRDGGERTISGDNIFIDTGTRAAFPGIPGLEAAREHGNVLDNVSIMELDRVPEHLVVLGGGYIGVEFAQMFRRFGSRVTILQSGSHLLAREDDDIARAVETILREDDVEIALNARVDGVRGSADGITVEISAPTARKIACTHLLVATGRAPNTEALDLQVAGVQVNDKGFVTVTPSLATTVPGIYAIGDVKGGPAFTHISYDDFRVLRANLLEGKQRTIEGRMVPYTVFLDPQLGRIGMTEKEARAAGRDIRVAKMPMTRVARAREAGETRGWMKAIVERESEQILGAAILGMEGGEVMAMLQLAMMGKLPYPTLREGIFAHPTLAESLNVLFGNFEEE